MPSFATALKSRDGSYCLIPERSRTQHVFWHAQKHNEEVKAIGLVICDATACALSFKDGRAILSRQSERGFNDRIGGCR
jgi:hypothetical protein